MLSLLYPLIIIISGTKIASKHQYRLEFALMNQRVLFVSSDTEKTQNRDILKNNLLKEAYLLNECPFNMQHIQQSILISAPDIVVIYCHMANTTLVKTIATIQDKTPKPLIIFADYSDDTTIADSIIAGASAFVVDGLQTQGLQAIIDISLTRFKKFQRNKQHTRIKKSPIKAVERRNIDRAKGFLMRKKGISEDKAYQFLRKMAMNNNKRISQISQLVLKTPEIYQ